MKRLFLVFAVTIAVTSGAIRDPGRDECHRVGPCSCQINSTKQFINLSPLGESKHTIPLFTVRSSKFTYEWEPCTCIGFTCGLYSSTMCQTNLTNAIDQFSAGDNTAHFQSEETFGWTVSYTDLDDVSYRRTSVIYLSCNPTSKVSKLIFNAETPVGPEETIISFIFDSPYSCPVD